MICHAALLNGEIDLYAEYTGTGLTAILEEPVISDPETALRHVRRVYHERFGIGWLNPFGFNNTYAITVRQDQAREHGWHKISDLKQDQNDLRAGFTAEFSERADGYPGLSSAYGLRFMEVNDLEPSMMYKAMANGEVDVICAFATDGRIEAYRLKPLRDDKKFFPPYYAAPVIREECLEKNPGLEKALSSLGGLLDDDAMQRLNFQVDGKGLSAAKAVNAYLKSKGLI
jgi:glycine betaine/choline ABC-type transport system substrate-binding protein